MTILDVQTRRRFLILTGTGLVGVLAGCPKNNTVVEDDSSGDMGTDAGGSTNADGSSDADGSPDMGGSTDADGSADDCELTGDDISGPFYRDGVPIRNELDLYGDAGIALTLSGVVLDTDCNPIPNAVVDIWHADPTTKAVDDLIDSDSVDYDNSSSEMRYRGQTATDAEGRYSFHTKKPGWYLNGGTFRPMHIHVKVWVDGTERLTTQLYFQGDPYIVGDPWASADRSVALVADGEGAESGTFDFTVA